MKLLETMPFTYSAHASDLVSRSMRQLGHFSIFLLLCWLSQRPSYAMQQGSLGVHIQRAPESAVAPKGDEVVFECELNLEPERLEWQFRHASSRAIDGSNFHYLHPEDGYNITREERISKLRIFVSTESLGEYQCVAWFGSIAIASVSARLTLVSISIDNSNGYSHNGIRWSVAPKNCVLLRCGTVTSNPPAVWSFYRNGEKLPQTEVLAGNGALILNSVSSKDSGNYTCSAMNSITGTEVRLPQHIDLRVEYTDRMPPYFLRDPPTQVVTRPGETIVLECPGVGSPPPQPVWSSPNVENINNNRTKILPYGLQIVNVMAEDQGSYVCRLDNGIAPAPMHITKLVVLQPPRILRGPASPVEINEGRSLELECSASGNPQPHIYWLSNGNDISRDNETFHEDRRLVIKRVQKRHAGAVQCFARNEVGETSAAALIRVKPTQIGEEGPALPLGNIPIRPSNEHYGNKNKGKRKHMKTANVVPPSVPNVTRLSDNSVMLRWYVPRNSGLPIQFFKVQYRMMGDVNRTLPREDWQTTNENIPYVRRDRSHEGTNNFTSSVSGLKADCYYRFRIIAVYSNNDNKEGGTTQKFLLQKGSALGPSKSNLPAPELVNIEPVSETVVMLHWTLPANPTNAVDGFYAYYRPASSAGEYLKATVDGMKTRKFKIDLLEPGTVYEFKLQSFNALAASEFSAIRQGMTKKPATTPSPKIPEGLAPTKANEEDNSIYPVVAGAAGGGILLLIATIAACLCIKRRKNSQAEEDDKPQLDHIQADFVTPSVLGVSNHHKSGHRLNGVLPRMNITPNPLAQEADKNRNVMELRYMPTNNASQTTSTSSNTSQKSDEQLHGSEAQKHQQRSSSSCETLEASEGVTTAESNSPLRKPLPPLPIKCSNSSTTAASNKLHSNHTTPQKTTGRPQAANPPAPTNHLHTNNSQKTNSHSNYNLHNSQTHLGSHQGLHHAQPYHQTPPPGTPTMLHKRDYQPSHHAHQMHNQQHPPPVPPHQNNNHHPSHHHAYQQQPPQPMTPSMEQQRRTLERSARNLHYPSAHDTAAMNIDGMPTRIPSLRRTRRTSGNANNNNGGVGIPIVPGSPRVQRSPMPARAMVKRTRLGSHNDNISSGSLNSIEV